MPKVAILVGNIGSGKSTLSRRLFSKGYIGLSRDSLRYMFGCGLYVFDYDLEKYIHTIEIDSFVTLLTGNKDIVIDETDATRKSRSTYLSIIKSKFPHYKIIAIEMPRYDLKTSLSRRFSNPHGNGGKELWSKVWHGINNRYESPQFDEGFHKIVRLREDIRIFK